MKYLPFFLALLLVLSPTIAAASTPFGGFVTCEGAGCSACNFVDMINIIIKWLLGFVFVIFAVLMVSAGFGLVTSGGNQSALDSAKSKFQNAIVGIIIILAAWLIVDTVMKGLVKGDGDLGGTFTGFGPWSEVQCQVQAKPDSYPGGGFIDESTLPTTTTTPTNPVTPTGKLAAYAGYQFDEAIIDKVKYLNNDLKLRVSGGYRTPERNNQVNGAKNSNHLTGRAADLVGTPAEMKAGADWAKANGAREAFVHNAGSGTHLHVAW